VNLNLHLIAEELAPMRFERHLIEERLDLHCTYPIVYRSGRSFSRGPLYVARAEDLSENPIAENAGKDARFSLIIIGEPPQIYFHAPFNTLVTTDRVAVEDICDRLLDIFHRYYDWEHAMQEVIDQGFPLRQLGELSLPFIGNPFFAQGSGFQCLFHIDDFPQMRERRLYERYRAVLPLEDDEYFPLEMIIMLVSDPAYVQAINSHGPSLYLNAAFDDGSLYLNGGRSLFINIFKDESCIARIIVPEILHEFTDRDYILIDILRRFLGRALGRRSVDNYTRPRDLDIILQRLLEHRLIEEERIATVLHEFGWSISDSYLCMVLEPKSGERSPQALRSLALQLLPRITSECYLVFNGRIVLVFNLTITGISRDDTIENTVLALRDSLLIAGISATFDDFKNLYYFYLQASDALEAGQQHDSTFWLFRYEDYLLDIMVHRYMVQQIPETFWPEGLRRLAAHDADKSTNYLKLLRVYLENEMNVAETSRRLYLQRNTCLYRLNRIREIGGFDLDESDTRLELLLAFRIARTKGRT